MKHLILLLFLAASAAVFAQDAAPKTLNHTFTTGIMSVWSGKQVAYYELLFNRRYSVAVGLGATFRPGMGSELSKHANFWSGSPSYHHHDSPNWESNHDVADNYASFKHRHFKLGPVAALSCRKYFGDDPSSQFFAGFEAKYERQNILAERVSEEKSTVQQFITTDFEKEYEDSFRGSFYFGGRLLVEGLILEGFLGGGYRQFSGVRQDLGYDSGAFRNATRQLSDGGYSLLLGIRLGFSL